MNLEEYWQENKRFVTRVGAGIAVFLVATVVIDRMFGADLRAAEVALSRAEARAAQPAFTAADESAAREDNTALLAALAELETAVDFRPRAGFRPTDRPATSGRYIDAVAAARESLLPAARRRGMVLDPSLGLPEQSPTREEDLSRHLDALDLVERVARIALDEGVQRIDRIRTRIDPGLYGRDGAGYVERTRVEFTATGKSAPLAAVVHRLARVSPAIVVESVVLESSRQRADEARLELVVLAPRIARVAEKPEAAP